MQDRELPNTSPQVLMLMQELLSRGAKLHAAGQLEPASLCFEQALANDPHDLSAINACVSVLLDLNRPDAAYRLMQPQQERLLEDADSGCNWAIVCETVGDFSQASLAYERVLAIAPDHLRALNNSALAAMGRQDWQLSIERLRRGMSIAPAEPALCLNLIDAFTAAHESAQALALASQATKAWPDHPDLEIRYAVQLAFNGLRSEASLAFENLSQSAQQRLQEYLRSMGDAATRVGKGAIDAFPLPEELYLMHGFAALADCDWRGYSALLAQLKSLIAQSYTELAGRDWRDVQFAALMLPLSEEELSQTVRHTYLHILNRYPTRNTRSIMKAPAADGRIHIALAIQSLHDARHRNAIENWLKHSDRGRFAYHVYANTPSPQAILCERIQSLSDSFVEINHLSAGDTIKRMRLDAPDIYIDAAFYTPWCRAELPYGNIAPVQIRQQSWQRWNSGVYHYVIGDAVTHPEEMDRQYFGPTVRLPNTSWLALNDDLPMPGIDRKQLGLPESAQVFAAFCASATLDPESFKLWMKLLKTLPDAVLWLPAHTHGIQQNLLREAAAHSVPASRLIFCKPPHTSHISFEAGLDQRAMHLAQLQCADFFLDPLRFSSSYNLCDALRLGVPSAAALGNNLASRLGASILQAAHLPEAVAASPEALFDLILEWSRQDALAKRWQQHLHQVRHQPASVPLFDAPARIGDWEKAMAMMLAQKQSHQSLAFDVP